MLGMRRRGVVRIEELHGPFECVAERSERTAVRKYQLVRVDPRYIPSL